MKIEPELVDHPKFLLLRKRVGADALEYLVRMWGHCEANKRGELWRGAGADYVEAVCRWKKRAGDLFLALTEIGWLHEDQGGVRVHDWEAMNWRRVSNWGLGSRPKNKGQASEKPRLNPPGSPLSDMTELSELSDVNASEIPSEATVLKAAAEYPGDLARAIPPVIPEGWVLNWYAWRLTPAAGPFPKNWQEDLERRFRAGWANGDPRTGRGKKIEKNGAAISANVEAIESGRRLQALRAELRELEQEIEALVAAGAAVPAEKTARERELRREIGG